MDIKQSSELCDDMAQILNDVADAFADDGKLSIMEEIKLAIKDSAIAYEAMNGAQLIPAEFMDLDKEEAQELVAKAMNLANAGLRLFNALAK